MVRVCTTTLQHMVSLRIHYPNPLSCHVMSHTARARPRRGKGKREARTKRDVSSAFDDVVDSAAREEARRRTTMRVSRAAVSVTRASSMVRGRTTTRAVATAAYGRPERIARVKGRDGGASRVGEELELRGWARSVRTQKGMAFIDLNDGSAISGMQAVVNEGSAAWEVANSGSVSTGAALRVKGKLVASPGGKQAAELAVDELEVIGAADSETYPLQKKRHTLEYLRSIAHLRPRTNTIGAVARVRNQLAYATHKFFQEHGFLYANTPIVTASDCEGAGEQFQVTTLLNGFAAAAAATPEAIAAAEAAAKEQGEVVKAVKEAKKAGDASKEDVDGAVAKLLSLKSEAEALAGAAGGASLPKKDDGSIDYSQDFFGKPSYLTVSGQLNGEIMACAVNDIYTFGPTFRAENSNTSRHLAEFWMVEPELAFADLNDDMDCAEAYLKYCLNHVLENCDEDLAFFEKNISKDNLRERLRSVATQEFARITYTEAVDHILNAKKKFEFPIKWGADLQSEHERYITEEVFKNRPVIVRDYPKDIKAFYMRLNDDNKTVAAMDVLVPRVGELMGGSQREERLDVLERRIEENGLEKESYWWYLDLRRYGSQPHAGFGLGFERLVCYVSGVENIRDAIPFPRYPGSAEF